MEWDVRFIRRATEKKTALIVQNKYPNAILIFLTSTRQILLLLPTKDVSHQLFWLLSYQNKQRPVLNLKTALNIRALKVGYIVIMLMRSVLVLCVFQKVSIRIISTLLHKFQAFGPKNTFTPITKDGIGGISYLKQGIDEIIRLIDVNIEKWGQFWGEKTDGEELLTRAGIASWDAEGGVAGILSHSEIDVKTFNMDFSSDILARAQFFAENGYGNDDL